MTDLVSPHPSSKLKMSRDGSKVWMADSAAFGSDTLPTNGETLLYPLLNHSKMTDLVSPHPSLKLKKSQTSSKVWMAVFGSGTLPTKGETCFISIIESKKKKKMADPVSVHPSLKLEKSRDGSTI